MDRPRSSLVLVVLVLWAAPASRARSGWFGPKDYNECILDRMKGVTSDVAARAIAAACREKFPEAEDPGAAAAAAATQKAIMESINGRDLRAEELAKLKAKGRPPLDRDARAKLSAEQRGALPYVGGDAFHVELYNGNDAISVKQLTIEVTTTIDGKVEARRYNSTGAVFQHDPVAPLGKGAFDFDIVQGDKGAKYEWALVSARGGGT